MRAGQVVETVVASSGGGFAVLGDLTDGAVVNALPPLVDKQIGCTKY